jgi:hypothetical protein
LDIALAIVRRMAAMDGGHTKSSGTILDVACDGPKGDRHGRWSHKIVGNDFGHRFSDGPEDGHQGRWSHKRSFRYGPAAKPKEQHLPAPFSAPWGTAGLAGPLPPIWPAPIPFPAPVPLRRILAHGADGDVVRFSPLVGTDRFVVTHREKQQRSEAVRTAPVESEIQ